MRLAALGNQYVTEQEPWALLESDRDRAGTILYVALRAIDSLKVLLTPFLPFSSQRLHELLGYDGVIAGPLEFRTVTEEDGSEHVVLTGDYTGWVGALGAERAPAGPGAARAAGRSSRSSIPSRWSPTSSRAWRTTRAVATRRDRLARAPRRVRASRPLLVERRIARRRDAHRHRSAPGSTPVARRSRSRTSTTASSPPSGSIRTRRRPRRQRGSDELRELLAHPKAVAVGETGLDNARGYATPDEQRRLFDEQLALADELGLPVVIHSREADADTASALAGFAGTVVLHCFSSPDLLATALERGYYVSFAGNVTYPKAGELREAAAAVPGDRILVETDSPYLSPQPVRGRRNEPAHVVHTIAALAEVRGEERPSSPRPHTPTRPPPSGFRDVARPKKALGQHFLVDENILGVIGRLAALEPEDVVLEVGPGSACSRAISPTGSRPSTRSSSTARSRSPFAQALDGRDNVHLLFGDALRLDLSSLEPRPTKLVANLPYNIATPLRRREPRRDPRRSSAGA